MVIHDGAAAGTLRFFVIFCSLNANLTKQDKNLSLLNGVKSQSLWKLSIKSKL